MKKLLLMVLAVTIVGLAGCATRHSSLDATGGVPAMAYIGDQEEMLADIQLTILELFPGRKMEPIEGQIKGYTTYTRVLLDTYTQQAVLVPTKVTTPEGEVVQGYALDVSGSGTSGTGLSRNKNFYEVLKQKFDAKYKRGIPRGLK